MIEWYPVKYGRVTQRLESFSPSSQTEYHSIQAAQAGFYQTKQNELTCAFCFRHLHSSLCSDILIAEHALLNSECSYIRLLCTPIFWETLFSYESRYTHFPVLSMITRRTNELEEFYLPEESYAIQQCQLRNISLDKYPQIMEELKPLFSLQEEPNHVSEACIICFTHKKNILLLPCQHIILCKECIFLVDNQCPCCRKNIQFVLPVYY